MSITTYRKSLLYCSVLTFRVKGGGKEENQCLNQQMLTDKEQSAPAPPDNLCPEQAKEVGQNSKQQIILLLLSENENAELLPAPNIRPLKNFKENRAKLLLETTHVKGVPSS